MSAPTSLVTLGIIVLAVLPGSMYTWAFERHAGRFGVTLADRTFRFIAVSVLFHLVFGWGEYLLYRVVAGRDTFAVGQFAAAWSAVLLIVVLPALVGSWLGGLYVSRNSREGHTWTRNLLSADREQRLLRFALGRDPAPRAWEHLFAERPNAYVRVKIADGSWVAGLYADRSYVGALPHEADLLLEQAWELDEDGALVTPMDYYVYVPAGQIAWLEVILVGDGEEATDGEARAAEASHGEKGGQAEARH